MDPGAVSSQVSPTARLLRGGADDPRGGAVQAAGPGGLRASVPAPDARPEFIARPVSMASHGDSAAPPVAACMARAKLQ